MDPGLEESKKLGKGWEHMEVVQKTDDKGFEETGGSRDGDDQMGL